MGATERRVRYRRRKCAIVSAHSVLTEILMSVTQMLKSTGRDTVGQEVVLRVIGTREPPARMVIQVAVSGTASVQIQGRIARDAPWQDLGPVNAASALFHVEAVQFLRAVASGMAADASVSVWAVWAW